MQSSWLALLFKPLLLVGFVFAYYLIVYKGSHFIGRFIKNPKLYDFLFRERGVYDRNYGRPARPADSDKRALK